jgi:hypothetical protein
LKTKHLQNSSKGLEKYGSKGLLDGKKRGTCIKTELESKEGGWIAA